MGLTVVNGRTARARSDDSTLREAITSVSRAIEDLSWQNLSQDERTETVITNEERKTLIRRARLYAERNPLGIQSCSLLVNYVLGQGISLAAANKTLVARIVDEFWENPVNQLVFTSQQSMSEFLLGAYTDGAQFLVLFPDADDGTVELGTIDALYVEDIINDPQNNKVPRWLKVRKPRGEYDFRSGAYKPEGGDDFVYYRFWRNEEPLGGKGAPKKVEPGLVYIAKRGKGKFGQSGLKGAIDWLKAHKDFMEDRATISRAAAAIAWKKKRKNATAGNVAAEADRLRSALASSLSTPGYETNPTQAAGATIIENEYSNLEWVKTDTGGQAALADERILRMMSGAAMGGIPNHYFGDEASANLATATAMELPLLKAYENWQQWLRGVIVDVVTFVIETAHEAERVGPRDMESKYAGRKLTAEKVADEYEGKPGVNPPPGAPPGLPVKEADVTVKVTGGDVSKGDKAAAPGAKPGEPPPPPLPPAKEVVFSTLDTKRPSKSEPVDWYVDVDFSPIVQKDIKPFLDSLKVLAELMPGSPESQKMVITMALTALGVNDMDKVLDRLFPLLPPGAKPSQPNLLPPSKPPTEDVREALSPFRVHRVLSVVREAADALDERAG
jgi:hypothetical protein